MTSNVDLRVVIEIDMTTAVVGMADVTIIEVVLPEVTTMTMIDVATVVVVVVVVVDVIEMMVTAAADLEILTDTKVADAKNMGQAENDEVEDTMTDPTIAKEAMEVLPRHPEMSLQETRTVVVEIILVKIDMEEDKRAR